MLVFVLVSSFVTFVKCDFTKGISLSVMSSLVALS